MKAEDHFDLVGNTPSNWADSAFNLLRASAEIDRSSRETVKKWQEAHRPSPSHTRSFWPRLMLRGFALECLIKAHYLLSNQEPLCSGGKYRGISKNERHDLQKLARSAKISLSANEAQLLDRLSAIVVGVGRYPVFRSFSDPRSGGDQQGLLIEWAEPQDEIIFREFASRLLQPFDPESLYKTIIEEA